MPRQNTNLNAALTRTDILNHQSAFCAQCSTIHSLARSPALAAAHDLMAHVKTELATPYLYGEARGKMFGVLSCQSASGKPTILKAFSGQYHGQWELEGWVPPLFAVDAFKRLNDPVEKEIKALGVEATATTSPLLRTQLRKHRKQLSQNLMKDIHALYKLHNFKGQKCSLTDLFPADRGIPTGSGDCCAPKLLNFAARNKLRPLAILEFYWGRSNRSATRHEGNFYLACDDKCGPILGFLLCGCKPEVWK